MSDVELIMQVMNLNDFGKTDKKIYPKNVQSKRPIPLFYFLNFLERDRSDVKENFTTIENYILYSNNS